MPVSSNKAVLPEAKTPQEALLLLRRITALPHHVFWVDDVSLASSEHVEPSQLLGSRQVADAHPKRCQTSFRRAAAPRCGGARPWSGGAR